MIEHGVGGGVKKDKKDRKSWRANLEDFRKSLACVSSPQAENLRYIWTNF